MPEVTAPASRVRRAVLIWAVIATLAVIVLSNIALLLWLRLRQMSAELNHPVQTARGMPASAGSKTVVPEPAAGSFANVQESNVAGRYRFFEEGNEVGTITLLPNHSMINKDGTTFRQYHWEIQPDGIMTVWQRNRLLFDVIEKPGVYIARGKDGAEYRRMEKIPE